MSGIQLVLSVSVIAILVTYLRFFRNRVFNALFFLGFFLAGLLFILRPSLTQDLAHLVGVGRGADLVFYLLFMGFFLLFLALFQKTRHLGKTIIDMVRNRAIDNARVLGPGQQNK